MACISAFAPTVAMATTRLARAVHYADTLARPPEVKVDHRALSMSWVVVTDSKGNRKLQIRWTPSADRG